MQNIREEIDDNPALTAAINLTHSFLEGSVETTEIVRSRNARIITSAIPSTLNAAFLEIMDNPKPFYDALRKTGLDDHGARHRLSLLPIAAAGGYGLKPEHFRI